MPATPNTRSAALGAALALAFLTLGCPASEPTSNALVFEGMRIIVGDGSAPIENGVFVVEEDRFLAAGAAGQVETPPGAHRIDLTGRTVIPALVDSHVHLSVPREELIDDLNRRAYYGVGAALSLGHDDGDAALEVRAEPIRGAARALTAGRGITRPEPGRSEAPYWVDTEEEARAAVRELAEKEVDIVKIWVDDRGGRYEKMTPELYGAVIEEAHTHGLRVTAHIYTLEDAKGLLRAGVDSFAHGVRDMEVDDEFVELVRERLEVVLVPNMGSSGVFEDLGWLSGTIKPDELAELQAGYQDRPDAQARHAIEAANLARLHAEGMKIALGTDGNAGWRPHIEMADMVAAGLTPHEVLVSATSSAAEFLRLDDMGTIAAGKSADFVVLEGNPLDDITNTRRIESVYLRGKPVDREVMSANWLR